MVNVRIGCGTPIASAWRNCASGSGSWATVVVLAQCSPSAASADLARHSVHAKRSAARRDGLYWDIVSHSSVCHRLGWIVLVLGPHSSMSPASSSAQLLLCRKILGARTGVSDVISVRSDAWLSGALARYIDGIRSERIFLLRM